MEKEDQIFYACPTCGMEVNEDEFLDGQTSCQNENCDNFGQPLEKMQYCPSCNEYYTSDSADEHLECS